MKKLILVDGNSIFHRAYHALPPFKTKNGELVNAVYGFSSMLLGLLENEKPDYIAIAFDTKAKTFRHEKYVEYKATRIKAPDDLYAQLPRIKEIVRAFQIPIFELDGFEADDLIGTIATQAEKMDDIKTFIVSGDKDVLQLVSDKINVIMPIKGVKENTLYDFAKVQEKFGISPKQIKDLKGLQGDLSDNIKGVNGVGIKTATQLIQKYGSVEGIYENIDEIKGKLQEKLEKDRENAFFSKELATIITDAPKNLEIQKCIVRDYDHEKIRSLFQELNFNSLSKRFDRLDKGFFGKKNEREKSTQPALF